MNIKVEVNVIILGNGFFNFNNIYIEIGLWEGLVVFLGFYVLNLE